MLYGRPAQNSRARSPCRFHPAAANAFAPSGNRPCGMQKKSAMKCQTRTSPVTSICRSSRKRDLHVRGAVRVVDKLQRGRRVVEAQAAALASTTSMPTRKSSASAVQRKEIRNGRVRKRLCMVQNSFFRFLYRVCPRRGAPIPQGRSEPRGSSRRAAPRILRLAERVHLRADLHEDRSVRGVHVVIAL